MRRGKGHNRQEKRKKRACEWRRNVDRALRSGAKCRLRMEVSRFSAQWNAIIV